MKRKTTKNLSMALAVILTASSIPYGNLITAFADTGYVTESELSDNQTAAPAADDVVPDANQYQYQKEELSAFCHFGPNTFNEIEWGENYGNRAPSEIFTLREGFDAETLVSTLKEAGFQKLIVTAKHHDGFCIWNSQYTEYDVAAAGYKDADGNPGDVLAEISAACTKYDMDMGLYLSPWDINAESYGYYDANGNATTAENDVLDYNEYYNNQLKEILGNDEKYGNNGHFTEVWMDGAKGSGANAQEYDFELWFETIQSEEGIAAGKGYEADCMLFGAESYTTVRWIGNENGYANEETWAKSIVNKESNTIDSKSSGGYTIGYENGNQWTVPESDARITSGWFWGTTKNTPKSISDLGNMYFGSVGHNSVLLLNVPPNNQGTVDEAILERVKEFGQEVKDTFGVNLAANAEISATEVRGNDLAFKPSNVIDGDDATYWTTDDGTTTGSMILNLGSTKTFDVVSIEEAIQFGQRITSFKVEYRNGEDDSWKTFDEGTTIGSKRLSRKAPVKADAIKITVSTESEVIENENVPMISEVGVYKASEGFELVSAAPDGMEVIDITDSAFTLTGNWTAETGTQFINGTNSWANGNTSGSVYAELSFTGSKVYLLGTLDPNHGEADIYIDGNKVATIDTGATSRALGQILYESETLADGDHTLKLIATESGKAIGLEAAYVINNGGLGMIGFEKNAYTMDEDDTIYVKLLRIGGTAGEVSVTVTPNPGSAIQDDFDTENIVTVTFADGETEKEVPVITKRNTNETGEQYFTIELSSDNDKLILGMNEKAKITIIDADDPEIANSRTYSEKYPFEFPTEVNETVTLEAERMVLENTGTGEQWPLQISESSWASNGKFVNAMNSGDRVILYYNAERTGTYTATLSLRSGDTKNGLIWDEENGKIVSGEASNIGASDSAGATHTAVLTFEVEEAGPGVLTFTAPEYNAPQMDKFEITAVELDPLPEPVIENPFIDVEESHFFYDAVLWAVKNNITQGTSDTEFSPSTECTRGQVVTFMWRAAGEPAPTETTCKFADVDEKAYYYDAVLWAVENGITDGTSDTEFSPDAKCTRGQIVTLLYRAEGEPDTAETTCKFVDVDEKAYYFNAVLWAVENGITDGTSDTQFSPDAKCTRGHIVTFLYRNTLNK